MHTFCFQRPNEKANRQPIGTNPASRSQLRTNRSSAVRRNALRDRKRKSIRRNVRLFKLRRIRPWGRFRLHVFQNLKFTKKSKPEGLLFSFCLGLTISAALQIIVRLKRKNLFLTVQRNRTFYQCIYLCFAYSIFCSMQFLLLFFSFRLSFFLCTE